MFVDSQLTRNFWRREMLCACGCERAGADIQIIQYAQALRDYTGRSVIIHTDEGGGFRCHAAQMAINPDAPKSYHLTGQAIDFHVDGLEVDEYLPWILSNYHDSGIGRYEWGLHWDSRGMAARWEV